MLSSPSSCLGTHRPSSSLAKGMLPGVAGFILVPKLEQIYPAFFCR